MKTVTLLPGEVLVTGSSGLIGSALCAALQPRMPSRGEADPDLAAGHIPLDVLSPAELRGLPVRPRAVVHLAGDGQPTTAWNDVAGMFRSTVETCVTVMDTLMPQAFLFTSTCAVYGETPPEGARARWAGAGASRRAGARHKCG